MSITRLFGSSLFVALSLITAPRTVLASDVTGSTLGVSVTVVRSCTVTTLRNPRSTGVSLSCGRSAHHATLLVTTLRSSSVAILRPDPTTSPRKANESPAPVDALLITVVTINF